MKFLDGLFNAFVCINPWLQERGGNFEKTKEITLE